MKKTIQQTPAKSEAQEGVSLLELACYGIGYLAGALFKFLVHIMRFNEERAQKYNKHDVPAFIRKGGGSLFAWQEVNLKPMRQKIRLLGYERVPLMTQQ